MFRVLGITVARFWPILLAAWVAALAVSGWFAPAWEAVTGGGEVASLPADSPSRRADELFHQTFPDQAGGSSIVLVLWRDDREFQDQDKTFIEKDLAPPLRKLTPAEGEDARVIGVHTLAEQAVGALLVSRDRKATLVVVELSAPFLDRRSFPRVDRVEELLSRLRDERAVPAGLQLAVTGSATAGRDLQRAEQSSVHAIEIWTLVVVIVILVLLYRAPLVAVIPLATVYVAVRLSLYLLALLAGAGALSLDRDTRIFITVLAYGAGVDYCVFLIARFREELDGGAGVGAAVANAIGHVGVAVTASAATVICGIAMLVFARFGKIHSAGLAIPCALFFVLCAALTFCAALLRVAGHWAFWPQLSERNGSSPRLAWLRGRHFLPNVWEKIGPVLLRRPGTIWLLSVAVLLPFAVVAVWRGNEQNYNPVSDLPANAPSSVGTRAVEQHFPPGTLGPITVLLKNEQIDFGGQDGIEQITRLTNRLREQKDQLDLVDIRSVADPLGTTPAAREALAQIPLPPEAAQSVVRQRAVAHYVSPTGADKGHVTRIDLVLGANPLSHRGLDDLDRIQTVLAGDLAADLHGSEVALSGPTASARDLASVKQDDERRVEVLVPIVVLVLLILVLRRIVVSLYLVLSVLFSYLATLGVTYLLFWLLSGEGFTGLDWKVPIFLFTILVAVGEDYNIFLVTRIREEQDREGPLAGISAALARTGRVITSCGFIMAGTFASLLSGSLSALKELGFALAFGVLLDTLVVRPILVPAFLVLLEGGHLGRVGQRLSLKRSQTSRERVA